MFMIGQYSSNRQDRLHTKMATQKQYEELEDVLSEWFKIFYGREDKNIFIDKTIARR